MSTHPKEEPYAYVKRYYGVDPVIGATVKANGSGKRGVIVRKRSYDQYVHVKFDGSKFDVPVHPLDLDYRPAAATPDRQQENEHADAE